MNKPQDLEAAETVQTTNVPAVALPRLVRPLPAVGDYVLATKYGDGDPSKVASPSGAFSVTGGSAVPEWMNTPEKRRDIWALQALAAAYVGDKEKADEYMARAVAEDRLCAAPRLPNISSQRTRHPMPDHQPTEATIQEQRPGSL